MPANNTAPGSTHVFGKVLEKDSRGGVQDILVQLFDLDAWKDPEEGDSASTGRDASSILAELSRDVTDIHKLARCVGSVITSATGEFSLAVTPGDFNLPRQSEQKPDLLLALFAPDEPGLDLNKRLLHLSHDIRFNAASSDAHVIVLPAALLKERAIPFAGHNGQERDATRRRASDHTKQHDRERDFNSEVSAHHGARAVQERLERKAFREDFIAKTATNFQNAPLRGVVITDADNIRDKNLATVASGLEKANSLLDGTVSEGVAVNLYLTPNDKLRLAPYLNNPNNGFAEIPEAEARDLLFRKNSSENPGTLLVHNNPIASFCFAESEATRCAKQHAGIVSTDSTPPASPVPSSVHPITDNDVLRYTNRLVRDVLAPDHVMRPELLQKREAKDVDTAVNAFSLAKGPAEVPAFYDFHTIQIAFDHVWKQLFDEAIPNLAYTATTLAKAKFGIPDVVGDFMRNGVLTADVLATLTTVDVPAVVARFFDVTKAEYNELSPTLRQELVYIANEILDCTVKTVNWGGQFIRHEGSRIVDQRIIHSLTEQGERLIDAVRQDDYTTLHRTLRDLHARLSSKYEFTVFAADKDYSSVNFGLVSTYRQQWTPLTYQAGNIVRTVPLAPGEAREYSVKVNKHEKRSVKEAKRNNSAVTNEHASTSRVEAEIMAKAQTKTTFGMTAEGDFNVGIYEGKGSTTFGVEAIGESAQNRKDFREAVLKAVQEYKSETSLELTTETDFSSESVESGSIKNENQEVSVSFVFYELQKRFRVSEQLHRVMPVVLVAQPVPSPDQITPAWVIAHDWILNRAILDDSFRPTLTYLATKSVGDDFALRELKRNIRQQRSLVETLRIEFSSASAQADTRYAALEAQISTRINAEEREANDGLLNDIADFVGRGPGLTALFGDPRQTDPEAAKARELAAKDAHQYALEKAEKAAAALKQEINTLHTLTQEYNKTLQARLDNETQVKRLLVHIRDNIFYYMQAIWKLEPPDQRYLRLHKVQVPVLELESRMYRVNVETEPDIFAAFREPGTEKHRAFLQGKLKHNVNGTFDTKPLVEVADLSKVISCIGNYMVFALKEHNALTEFMAAPYIDAAFGAMDPDELSNVSLDEYARYVCCLHHTLDEAGFNAIKGSLRDWLTKLMATPLRNGDEIVVPTGSLFIEALVDQNSLLEDFKLKHRELDVYKAQAEVRRAELENVRLAARLLNDDFEDPDVERKIVIEGPTESLIVPPGEE